MLSVQKKKAGTKSGCQSWEEKHACQARQSRACKALITAFKMKPDSYLLMEFMWDMYNPQAQGNKIFPFTVLPWMKIHTYTKKILLADASV